MSKLQHNLTSVITTLALVVAGFAAVTHHHDHSSPGHSCSLHAQHSAFLDCCNHQYADQDDGSVAHEHGMEHDCCGENGHQHQSRQTLSLHEAGGVFSGDHLCSLCRFLTEHAAQISPIFDVQTSQPVCFIAPSAVSHELKQLPPAFLQRGPPSA